MLFRSIDIFDKSQVKGLILESINYDDDYGSLEMKVMENRVDSLLANTQITESFLV